MIIAIIIPTYNEAKSIEALLDRIRRATAGTSHTFPIVVVDGNSPDGTALVVRKRMKEDMLLHLVMEPGKRGIAMAYVDGIKYAMHTLHADAFFEFDGDGQHKPEDIPRMVRELEQGADYIIGSRYIPGGAIPASWGMHRKLLSRFGSLYTRLLLELPVHDTTSGFKLSRVSGFAEHLPLEPTLLLSKQYAYKLHFLDEMVARGARVKEVPIVFELREHDASKSSFQDVVESLRVIALLRLRRLASWRLPKVLCIGGIGFLLQTALFELLGIRLAWIRPSLAAVFGGEVAILSNFFLNNRFTFRDRIGERIGQRLLKFHMISAGSIFLQWLFVFLVEELLHPTPALLRVAYFLGVGLGFLFNYTGYYFFVWKGRKEKVE